MKAIITGMRGTVAPVLAAHLQQHGHQVIAWDRTRVPTDDYDAIRQSERVKAFETSTLPI